MIFAYQNVKIFMPHHTERLSKENLAFGRGWHI
nr:MAG TPA: hypothetical protein [Caudoviricetes sp.]DAM48143.1 MAG TPA: hypothetical protein [Caudoviricetes sp.]